MAISMRQHAISYFADMVASPLLAAALSSFALTHFAPPAVVEWGLMCVIGVVLWTLVEYAIHRVGYHRIGFLERYHEIHHKEPRAYVGAPPMLGTILVFLVAFVPLAPFSPIFADGLSVGMLMGYTGYLIVHYACHFWTAKPGGYLYRARLHHAAHHHRDSMGNFGVTTSIWDRAFGTLLWSPNRHSLGTWL